MTESSTTPAVDVKAELEAISQLVNSSEKADWEAALERLEALEAEHPASAEAQCLRGYAHANLEHPQRALNALLEASYLRPNDFKLFHQLAKQHARLGHDRACLGALRRCHQLAPKNVEIKRMMAALCFITGQRNEAEKLRRQAVREKPFYISGSATENTKIRVLVLQTAYSTDWSVNRRDFTKLMGEGHNNLPGLLDERHIQRITLYVDELANHPEIIRKLPAFDVIYNGITDAERCEHALGLAMQLCHKLNKPVINQPEAVLNASREGNYARFKDHEAIILPRAVKLENVTGSCCGAVREALEKHELELPLIVRVAGYQGGKFMHKVEDVDTHDFADIDELLAKGPETLYCIRYHDSGIDHPRAPGATLYPKYRAFMVNGKLYPIHAFFGHGEWNVHKVTHDPTAKRFPWLIDEWEKEYLEEPSKVLPAGMWDTLEIALRQVDIDYLGVDFSVVTEPGDAEKLVIFESNPAMRNWLDRYPPESLTYSMYYRVTYAVHDMLAQRAGVKQWDFELHPGQPEEEESAAPEEPTFDWQFTDRLIAVDNAAHLPRQANFHERMASNAFAVVAFDPASRVVAGNVASVEEFQHIPHALLGNGQPATLYTTLDEALTATLEPLPAERQSESQRSGAQVLTRLPVNTLRLDDIDGLARLDWLILDERADALAVLENGARALQDTLLLQVGVAFTPTYVGQHGLDAVSHWASRHGFAFYRLHEPSHQSHLPERDGLARTQATQLTRAEALFIPNAERMAKLDDNARQRLAFLLDTVYGIHDLPYRLLADCDTTLAEDYLKARGYVKGQANSTQ
ncbi:hypothetical protein GCM10022228_11580 [Halomonas cibimaris]|uniref:Uncharacterized protein n=1 Tax=Halomonas cibimaris TaxID=657012 RepID=A0ABP7LPL0_9GAMM